VRKTAISCAVAIVMLTATAAAHAGGYIAIDSWGASGTGYGQFRQPKGIAIDRHGYVSMSDNANDCIDKFTADWLLVDVWGHHGTAPGLFWEPGRIAIAPDDTLYVTDALNHRVQHFTLGGDLLGVWGHIGSGKGEFDRPRGVAVGPDGLVYVTDQLNNRIEVFTSTGRFVRTWGRSGSAPGQFYAPKDVAVAPDGRVIVADSYNERIQVFTPTGGFVAAFGSKGLAAGRFAEPRGVEVDARGHIFVCDSMNDRMQEFATDYSFVRAWGCRGDLPGLFDEPRDAAMAPDGTLVVVDTFNHRVQRFALSALADDEPPLTTSDAPTTWSRAPVSVSFSATDTGGSRVTATYARIGSAASFALVTGPLVADRQGVFALQYLSVDAAGNQELVNTRWLRLDWTKPLVTPAQRIDVHVRRGDTATLTVSVADNVSRTCQLTVHVYRTGTVVDSVGFGSHAVTPAGHTFTLRYTCALAPGRYLLRIFAKDQAGNAAYCRVLVLDVRRRLERPRVDTALAAALAGADPAAIALIRAGRDLGARRASKRPVALSVERVHRDAVESQILPDFALVPQKDRVQFEEILVAFFDFEVVRARAPFRAAQACDPAAHAHLLDRPTHRLHLEQVAALVRVGLVELVGNLDVVLVHPRLRIPGNELVHELLGLDGLEARRHDEAADLGADALGEVPHRDGILAEAVGDDETVAVLPVRIADEIERPVDLLLEVEIADQIVDLVGRRRELHLHTSCLLRRKALT